ncbi:hypothetical protein IAR55_002320 [Kwoniella newhampshirensis]|uniref:Uncharacterized protein n=1 Tax=Kwoniella newhampshirensis TaxID=1651941 RepID=A0AAW0Z0Z1_9TREE
MQACKTIALFALLPFLAQTQALPLFGLGSLFGGIVPTPAAVGSVTSIVGAALPVGQATSIVGSVVGQATGVAASAISQETKFVGSAIGDASKIAGAVIGQATGVIVPDATKIVGSVISQVTGIVGPTIANGINVAGSASGSGSASAGASLDLDHIVATANGALAGNVVAQGSSLLKGLASGATGFTTIGKGAVGDLTSIVGGAVNGVSAGGIASTVGGIAQGAVPAGVVSAATGAVGQVENTLKGVTSGSGVGSILGGATSGSGVGSILNGVTSGSGVGSVLNGVTSSDVLGQAEHIVSSVVPGNVIGGLTSGSILGQAENVVGGVAGQVAHPTSTGSAAAPITTATPTRILQALNTFVGNIKPVSAVEAVEQIQTIYYNLAYAVQNQAAMLQSTVEHSPFITFASQLVRNLDNYLKLLPSTISSTTTVISIAAELDASLAAMIGGIKASENGAVDLATALYADGMFSVGAMSTLIPRTIAILPPIPAIYSH